VGRLRKHQRGGGAEKEKIQKPKGVALDFHEQLKMPQKITFY